LRQFCKYLQQGQIMWDAVGQHIQSARKIPFSVDNRRSVSGGSINQAFCIRGSQQQYFVKLNQASKVSMFEAEALGLKALAAARSVRIPQVICWGTAEGSSYIVLEWLDLKGSGSASRWMELGRQLAQMHRTASSKGFGWDHSNTIGSTSQPNPWTQDWGEFFAESRIGYQLRLAQGRGASFPHSETLLAAIPKLLGHRPAASLVHGDLWSGNVGFTASGEPTIFDPAAYWGDREVDLAMTELFGGFPQGFYEGYRDVWPLDSGYEVRKAIYNLYHILNHFNLFGGSYRAQAEQMMQQIIR
jgi:fructosamine-3-kinase